MKKETYNLLVEILENRLNQSFASGNMEQYHAYCSALDMIEYANKDDICSLSQFYY